MTTIEKLTLVGGSILLSALLIFSLQGTAKQLLPSVQENADAISTDFYKSPMQIGLEHAQKKNVRTGTWGTSKYYIDKDDNMYVQSGSLQGTLADTVGTERAGMLRSLNFTDKVQTPKISAFLLSAWNGSQSNLVAINGLENFDTSQTTDMSNLFTNDTQLKSLDLSHWNVQNVQDLSFAFYNLKSMNYTDVSSWQTSSLKRMNSTFANDISTGVLKLNNWDTRQVTDMSFAFLNNWALRDVYVSNWNTRNVTNMNSLFSGDGTIQNLDLSHWDVSRVNDASYAFANNFALQHLYLHSQFPDTAQQENVFANSNQLTDRP